MHPPLFAATISNLLFFAILMISVIICSRNAAFLNSISLNIAASIGTDFEIIAINNIENPKGICEVYNTGAGKAKYPYLCFVHEDVIFKTALWGKIAISYFENDPLVAMLGFAGSIYKCRGITGWSEAAHNWPEIRRMHMYHHADSSGRIEELMVNPFNETVSQVAIIDGVCMITRKELWEQYNFSQGLFTGFHGYDFDFSLGIGQMGKVLVSHEIIIEHFSHGTRDWNWFESLVKVHKKWRAKLPVNISNQVIVEHEYDDLIKQLRKHLLVIAGLKPGFLKYLRFYFASITFISDNISLKKRTGHVFKNLVIAVRYYIMVNEKAL